MGLHYNPEGDYLPHSLRAAGIAARSTKAFVRYLCSIEARPRAAKAWSPSTLDNTLIRYGFRPVTNSDQSRHFWHVLRDRARMERRAITEARNDHDSELPQGVVLSTRQLHESS